MSDVTKSFCVLPWIHSFVNNGGEYQVCCTGEEFKNFNRNDKNEIIHIGDYSEMNPIINSKYMKQFRLEMLSGKLPASCERCRITEECGGQSRRIIENNEYQARIPKLIKETGDDGEIGNEIIHIDYRLGNSCNLQCRMCNPRATKKWVSQHKSLPDHLQDEDFKLGVDNFLNITWDENAIFIDDFKAKCKNIEKLHFGGGEPLLSPKMKELLTFCVTEGISKKITLSYNTNLTILNKDILDLWKEFKGVKLLVSVDGVEKTNDYIRYPSKWDMIDKNLKFLDENYCTYNISEIMISTTVQINNILHLNELFRYVQKFNFVTKVPNLIILYYPTFLRANLLPSKLNIMATIMIQDLIDTASASKDIDNYLVQNLKQVKNFISVKITEDERLSDFQKFIEFSNIFDKGKKMNLIKVNPEFKTFISEV